MAWIDYALRRHRFRRLESFVMFIGYPRSGHSLVGALLNAHPQAVIAHELFATRYFRLGFCQPQLLALLLRRDEYFRARGWVNEDYGYEVPGGFQGNHGDIRVIGDKKGGGTSWHMIQYPRMLDTIRRRIDLPLRFIHNVRNPYDNIATAARRERRSIPESIERYRTLASSCQRVMERLAPDELLQQWHEDFVRDVEGHMRELCAFVGLSADPSYLAACAEVVFESPKLSRDSATWTREDVDRVEALCREFPFLARYAGSPVTISG